MAGDLVDTDYVDDRCPACCVERVVIERLDKLIIDRKAESLAVNSRCGHTMVYRSLGLWTNAIAPTLHWIIEKMPPPPIDTLERRIAEHNRLIVASDSI
jgi:hypothetical protein